MSRQGGEAQALLWVLLAPLAATAAVLPGLQAACLAVLPFPALVAYSRFRLDGLVIAFLVCQSLVHFMKRLVFLLGPQPQAVYFGVQLLPTVVLLLLMVATGRHLRGRRLPWSGRLLLALLGLSTTTTLLSLDHLPWLTVLSAVHQQLLPFLLFFAGLLLTPDQFCRVGRTLAVLACISVLYGLLQILGGPTPLDRAWAAETYAYSIHGGKVFAYMEGVTPEFRSYSYYADPLTWGFFLLAGLAGGASARAMGGVSRGMHATFAALAAGGLFFSMTRTVWAGLAVILACFGLLGWRRLRRPWLIFTLVLAMFAGAALAGGFLYRELFLGRRMPVFQSAVLARYTTVGTIEARTSAWNDLKQAVSSTPAWGYGFAVTPQASHRQQGSGEDRPLSSHNFLVELVVGVGVPGALLFLAFFWSWLREVLTSPLGAASPQLWPAARWLVAYATGTVVTGYLNGPSSMTSEWFLILGAAAGFRGQAAATGPGWSVRRTVQSASFTGPGLATRAERGAGA